MTTSSPRCAAEGIPCGPGYFPLTRSEAILRGFEEVGAREGPRPCPIAERVAQHEACYLTQNLLLGTHEDMDDIVAAVAKIQRARG